MTHTARGREKRLEKGAEVSLLEILPNTILLVSSVSVSLEARGVENYWKSP